MNNEGISFGLKIPGIVMVTSLIVGMLAYYAVRKRSPGLMLMVTGGAMNLWERVNIGYINDYWKIPMVPIYNNLNDWLIFLGLALYLWQQYRHRQ